jgi:hypothetical protein
VSGNILYRGKVSYKNVKQMTYIEKIRINISCNGNIKAIRHDADWSLRTNEMRDLGNHWRKEETI